MGHNWIISYTFGREFLNVNILVSDVTKYLKKSVQKDKKARDGFTTSEEGYLRKMSNTVPS